MDTNTTTCNPKMLKVIFGGYALVAAFATLFYIFQNEVFHFSSTISMVFAYTVKIINIILIGWAAIAGKRVGINKLGRVAAWIAISSLLLINATIIYRQFLFMDSEFNYIESMSIMNILTGITTSLGLLLSVSLTLMAIGSKLKLFPMIAFAVTLWVSELLWLTYGFLGFNYYLAYMISDLVIYTASGIIILCFPTRE